MFADPLTERLAAFVRSVGIDVERGDAGPSRRCFPGLDIRYGAVLIDESRLIQPGRHPARGRPYRGARIRRSAWRSGSRRRAERSLRRSHGLTRRRCISGSTPTLVFYPGSSFQGEAPTLIENFAEGRYIGVPLLQRYGMSVEPRPAAERGVEPFPHMLRWVR